MNFLIITGKNSLEESYTIRLDMVSTLGVSSDDNDGSFMIISEYIHISLQFPLISTTMIYYTDASTKKRFVGLYALNNFEIDHNDYLLWNAHRL